MTFSASERVSLGDAGTWLSGGTPLTTELSYWDGNLPWISAKSLTEFHLRDSDRRLTQLGAQSGTKVVEKNAILMVVRGMSLKTEFRMGIAMRKMAFSQDCKALIARPGIDPLFLAYALKERTQDILDMVDEAGHGTGRLQTDLLYALKIAVPNLDEQRGIAATLGALDDKIESNRRLVGIVEDLIPSKVDATLGEEQEKIPVSGLAEFVNGGAYTKGASGTGRMVIRIAELNSGPGASTVYNDIEVPEDKTAEPGDILMAWSGSLGVHRWVMGEAIVNQHIFKVKPARKFPPWLVFDRLRSVMPVFQSIAKDKATTMGHIQRGHLTSTTIEVPSADLIESLDRELRPLWERLLVAEQENIRLAELRNALLPELLSGRIRVPEAEEEITEVTL